MRARVSVMERGLLEISNLAAGHPDTSEMRRLVESIALRLLGPSAVPRGIRG